jgi:O-antigen ligase
MLTTVCSIILFFSIAQPGAIIPVLGDTRVFFAFNVFAWILLIATNREAFSNLTGLPQNKYIIGLLFAYTISEAQYFWISGTASVFIFWVKKLILYWLMISVIEDLKKLKTAIWMLIWAIGVLAAYGWNFYLSEPNLLVHSARIYSVGNYNNPNSLALVFTLCIPLAFALLEIERSAIKRLVLVVFMVTVFVTCAYTKSRGGTIGLLIAFGLSTIFSRRVFKSRTIKLIIIAIGAVGFMTIVLSLILSRGDVTSLTGRGGEASSGDRLMAWFAAVRMFRDHPLFGVGWGKFTEFAFDYGMDKRLLVHNTFLSVLAETGIVGAFFFGMTIISIIRQLLEMRKQWFNDKNREDELIICQGILISIICYLVNTSFSVKDHEPFYWALLGLAGIICKIFEREQKLKTLETLVPESEIASLKSRS